MSATMKPARWRTQFAVDTDMVVDTGRSWFRLPFNNAPIVTLWFTVGTLIRIREATQHTSYRRVSVVYIYIQGGPKNRTAFRLDNFVTVSLRKACSMSNFSKFYREKRYKTRISVSLNSLCQICSNRHNSWNYGIYDQNTWILLNLH